jgi:hypothetical protein
MRAHNQFNENLRSLWDAKVTVIEPESTEDGFPKGPASICIAGPPQRQCYTAPKAFGNNPTIAIVQLAEEMPALFFSAESGGVSGWQVDFALLRPRTGKVLENLFPSDITVSNQSQHAFWRDSAISDAQIFVTANSVWGDDESVHGEHRYMISAYVMSSNLNDQANYYLEDRYMTVRKYDFAKWDILSSEKQEILTRLRRLKAERGN